MGDRETPKPKMELDDLPDDELLSVLALVAPADLLRCRGVCRRWRALALHPAVWRDQSFTWEGPADRATARGILRWAPCLGRLALDGWPFYYSPAPAADVGQVLSTTCKVRDLQCDIFTHNTNLIVQVIERFAQLGRLRSLKIGVGQFGDAWEQELGTLLQHVIQTEGLHSLHIWIFDDNDTPQPVFPPLPPQLAAAAVPSSLRRLHYEYEHSGVLDPYLQLLLKQHAATLEAVGVWTVDPRAGALLSSMPRLRRLECLLQEDMTALALPASLRALDLDLCVELDTAAPARVPGLHALLHAAASRLEDLVLRCGRGAWADDPEVVELVRCLGGAGPGALRSLTLASGRGDATLTLRPLAGVLHCLPRLARLHIDCVPTAAFLEALDAAALPDLAVLTVWIESLKACEHRWAHSPEVRKVMARCPRLHIVIQCVRYTDGCQCRFCSMACHDLPPMGPCILFSHPRGSASCDVSHRWALGANEPMSAEVRVNVC